MRDSDKSCPCYNCSKRCAESGYNCHSDCQEYKEYQARVAKDKELLYKQRNNENAYIETRIKAAYKTAHKRRQQKAWREN